MIKFRDLFGDLVCADPGWICGVSEVRSPKLKIASFMIVHTWTGGSFQISLETGRKLMDRLIAIHNSDSDSWKISNQDDEINDSDSDSDSDLR